MGWPIILGDMSDCQPNCQPSDSKVGIDSLIPPICIKVGSPSHGLRLDAFLVKTFPDYSRNAWKLAIEDGLILVNGHQAIKSLIMQEHWDVAIAAAFFSAPKTLRADPLLGAQLTILYQDEGLIAIDKPAGLPCHPLDFNESGTIIQGLIALDPATAVAGTKVFEGGLVHRLDTETSGILLAARNPAAFDQISACFRQHQASKHYLAIVDGQLDQDCVVNWPIAHHARDGRRMVAIQPGMTNPERLPLWRGRPRVAESRIRVMQKLSGCTLVEVSVIQAQMHQIRIHLATLGHPLVADRIYGRTPTVGGLQRHALHAWRLDLTLPGQPTLHLRAALPADLIQQLVVAGGSWETGD